MSKSNKEKVLDTLKNKELVKVISGIQNYDKQKTLAVSMAAELGGATALDICDDEKIIKDIRSSVELPLFVSSISAEKLISAQKLDVDVLEIGNFENFYNEGKLFTPKEIVNIAQQVSSKKSKDILLCCTIPATLEVENQINLASELLNIGVDILQTEGFCADIPASDRRDPSYLAILKASSTLANTYELRKAFPDAHIITASGITSTTAPLAIAVGASGIGVGKYINSLSSQVQMTEYVKELMTLISTPTFSKEKVKAPVLH